MLVKKTVIKNIEQTADYLVRWSLRLPFGWSLKLHKILRPDEDRCDHDHPWPFWRFILRGAYTEVCGDDHQLVTRRPFVPYYCNRKFRHRIVRLHCNCSWTLILCGPNNHDQWGFFTKRGYLPWQQFVELACGERVLWCDDGRGLEPAAAQRLRELTPDNETLRRRVQHSNPRPELVEAEEERPW